VLKKSVFIKEYETDVWQQYELEKVNVKVCRKWAAGPSEKCL
jgi:hypothetical protein